MLNNNLLLLQKEEDTIRITNPKNLLHHMMVLEFILIFVSTTPFINMVYKN